uniref:RNase H type-1 domain-containing protein n=1 Tax=Hordeum vulgare subsp. vulgare TaxID=112509 RepID=A0A8I6Z078_HORVV
MSPLHSEAVSCLKGLQTAQELGMISVIVETDSMMILHAIQGSEQDKAALGVIFREIKIFARLNFATFQIVHCPRGGNRLADTLAVVGARMAPASSVIWLDGAPDLVQDLITSDAAGSVV